MYSGIVLALVLSAAILAQVRETITVSRVLVDVRVTEFGGEPVTDLTTADFDVRIGGRAATVESAEWVPESADAMIIAQATSTAAEEDLSVPAPRGRLIVVLVQTDFARDRLRTEGQLKFLHYAEKMMEAFEPEDRIAVFSFDSHLKFRLDFTGDKEKVSNAIRDAVYINEPPWPPIVPSPALFSRLNREEMRRAAHSETALLLIANALRPIPGPKSLLLLGWGLGHRTPIGVRMEQDWTPARYALDAARTSIFALDTTNADYHDLEVGLQTAAEQTGGFYAKTHLFPEIAVNRLRRTLSGHYELELRPGEDLKPGTQMLDVRVKRRGLTILAPASVVIKQ